MQSGRLAARAGGYDWVLENGLGSMCGSYFLTALTGSLLLKGGPQQTDCFPGFCLLHERWPDGPHTIGGTGSGRAASHRKTPQLGVIKPLPLANLFPCLMSSTVGWRGTFFPQHPVREGTRYDVHPMPLPKTAPNMGRGHCGSAWKARLDVPAGCLCNFPEEKDEACLLARMPNLRGGEPILIPIL